MSGLQSQISEIKSVKSESFDEIVTDKSIQDMSSSQVTSQSEEKETELVITNVSSDVQDKISSGDTTITKVSSNSKYII